MQITQDDEITCCFLIFQDREISRCWWNILGLRVPRKRSGKEWKDLLGWTSLYLPMPLALRIHLRRYKGRMAAPAHDSSVSYLMTMILRLVWVIAVVCCLFNLRIQNKGTLTLCDPTPNKIDIQITR
mmetsp:Transcript_2915/g.7615  ORF Transcript_2915/g.7615 Transcript_2915/m.7615 type:complete len:127 (+) Transcript_2915:302-682(+)